MSADRPCIRRNNSIPKAEELTAVSFLCTTAAGADISASAVSCRHRLAVMDENINNAMDSGAITEEEFAAKKRQLLGI